MGHLVEYEGAEGELSRALAALVVTEAKSSKRLAWSWAETAARHAEAAGVENAYELLGDGRWPEVEPLREALTALKAQQAARDAGAPVVHYPNGYYMTFREGVTEEEALAHVVERFRHVAIRPVSCSWLTGTTAFAAEFDRKLEEMVGEKEANRLRTEI